MKKIGIITYHFAKNYGAVLQCFALQTFLQGKGYDVEIINFVSDKQQENNDYTKHGGAKALIKNFCLIPFKNKIKWKNEKFEKFNLNYLNLTKRVTNINELKELITDTKYDIVISGSDQVFNPKIEDFNIAFLIPFKTEAIKMAYAASVGNSTANDLIKIKKYIEEFDYISIREKTDLGKFETIIKKEISVVCDPVMLLEKKCWDEKFNDKIIDGQYMICYFLHKDLFKKEYKFAKQIANEKNLKMFVINARYSKYSFFKNTLYDIGPEEFVSLIKNAECICTDSFHGVLFSAIFNKEFFCFDTKKNISDSRRLNLLKEISLENKMQYIENKNYSTDKTDYRNVNKKISFIKNNAMTFLEKINEK